MRIVFLAFVLPSLLSAYVWAQARETKAVASRLESEERSIREAAYKEIIGLLPSLEDQQRTHLVAQLIPMASKEVEPIPDIIDGATVGWHYQWRDAKHLSILLLGELRAAQAVDVLLANLLYRNPEKSAFGTATYGFWHPAADALVKIGDPAKPKVTADLEKLLSKPEAEWTDEDRLRIRLCEWIIEAIERKDDPLYRGPIDKDLPVPPMNG
jgi:hypothetical protein